MSTLAIIPERTRIRGVWFMFAAAAIYLALHLAGLHQLFDRDEEGMAALLEIVGTLYSVVYAFATYVIWGQFAAVENEILKESGALKISHPLQPGSKGSIAGCDGAGRSRIRARGFGKRVGSPFRER